MSKERILFYMHQLVSHNVIGDKQYNNRYKGFRGELHFAQWFRDNKPYATAAGGLFIPLVNTDDSFQDAIYILATPNHKMEYVIKQLSQASKLAKKGVFLLTYDSEEPIDKWFDLPVQGSAAQSETLVPYPSSLKFNRFISSGEQLEEIGFKQFSSLTGLSPYFSRQADIPEQLRLEYESNLSNFCYEDILELYVSRFVLDCLCSISGPEVHPQRGAPLDIDLFIKDKNDIWCIAEIKEKNLSKNSAFGMDVRRISSLFKLQDSFNMKSYYVIRHINDQHNRSFLDWKVISMNYFSEKASNNHVQGGFGMGPENGYNPTRLCNVKYFKSLMG